MAGKIIDYFLNLKELPDKFKKGSEAISNEYAQTPFALIIIDMQAYFIDDMPNEKKLRFLQNQIEVIRYCIARSYPIIVLEYAGCGNTVKELRQELKNCSRVTIIKKSDDDGFYNTNLSEKLTEFDTKTILLMGVNAGACVLRTAHSGLKNGFAIATSEKVITNVSDDVDYDKDISWFSKNSIYYNSDHLTLLNELS
jgi:nicotinamidase-related amidase